MPPKRPGTEEDADQEPLRPWEIAKIRHIIERAERIAWAWGVIKAAAAGAGLIVGTWLLIKQLWGGGSGTP